MEAIKLSKSIPWRTSCGVTGTITEIFPDRLRLELAAGSGDLGDKIEIIIDLPEHQQSFEFAGLVTKAGDGDYRDLVVGSNQQLFDLMGQVRKVQHIEICDTRDVEASDRFTGFSELYLMPEAVPEFNFADIDTRVSAFGSHFNAPILITGMTGGVERGVEINDRLAKAAAHHKIPMGVGSQRVALDNAAYRRIFDVKRSAPGVFLIGNIGGAQLLEGDPADLCRRAVEMVGADAIAIHLNVLQECLQVEGDRNFSGILAAIGQVVAAVNVPVVVKEVGSGVSPATAAKLWELGVSAIDVGGKGGTSWGYIEGLRSASKDTMDLADLFRDWGIPTAYALAGLAKSRPAGALIATGGIRDGLTIAKAVALGASFCGIGLPLMRAALQDDEGPIRVIDNLVRGLRIAMMVSGAGSLKALASRLSFDKPLYSEFRSHVESMSARS